MHRINNLTWQSETNGDVITKPETPAGVTFLAKINMIFYILLLFWALSFMFYAVDFSAGYFVLLSIAGTACCWGLLKHTKWSWYMAIAMWMTEGLVSSWAAYTYIGSYYLYPQSEITFVLIALFKFASTAYLCKTKKASTQKEAHVSMPPARYNDQSNIFSSQ